jgi:hypothetical protein
MATPNSLQVDSDIVNEFEGSDVYDVELVIPAYSFSMTLSGMYLYYHHAP